MTDTPTRRSLTSFIIGFALFLSAAFSLAQESPQAMESLSDKQHFQRYEDAWSEAINKRDPGALGLILSRDLIDISDSGAVRTRNQQLALLYRKGGHFSLVQRVENVRIFGNLAIVIGTYTETAPRHDTQATRRGMFTHIYHNVNGAWTCICAHSTIAADHDSSVLRKAWR